MLSTKVRAVGLLLVTIFIILAGSTASADGLFGIATIAGTPYDPSGDNGPATQASFGLAGIAFRAGSLYLTDGPRIRKIDPSGTITTVVGLLDPVNHQPIAGFSGDGGPALGAQIRGAVSLDFDSAGNLYIEDSGNFCVRKVTARVVGGTPQPFIGTEIITTVAGIGTVAGNTGDGGPATAAKLNFPDGIAIDPVSGTIYITDGTNNNVRKIDSSGIITTLAGMGGTGGFLDGPAKSAKFNFPKGVAVDPAGNVYVADVFNNRVRRIAGGTVTTFAGTGTSSASGNLNEGGAAIAANLLPTRVSYVDGILYIVDSGVGELRQINVATGIITTIAGSGLSSYNGAFPPVGDGGPALAALLGSGPAGIQDAVLDGANDVFIADASSTRIRFAANASAPATIFGQTVAAGNIATVAGPPGTVTFGGDGGPALSARLFGPGSPVVDPAGNLYIIDNNRIRRIDTTRAIATVAGNGVAGFEGVPGPATAAELQAGGLAFYSGNLYLTNNASRVLEDANNFLSIVTNMTGVLAPLSPNGTPAINALFGASGIAFDPVGNLYVGDALNHRIWKVDAVSGKVYLVAGGGSVVIDGVSVLSATATQAQLFAAGTLALDPAGNLYTTDGSKDRILKVTAHGANQPLDGTETVTVFAGTGLPGFSGDGGQATAAKLNGPGGLVFDAAGNLYFSDGINFRIRKIAANGIITTVAGTGMAGYSGDGGQGLSAQIRGGSLAIDTSGNLYFGDGANNVVRVLDNMPPTVTFGIPVPAPNANGWNNTSVTIPFTASDTGAGVASTNPVSPLVLSAQGAAVSGVVTASDRAGNSAGLTSPVVRIDETAPVISGMPLAGCSLWPPNGKMVKVATVTAADAPSGIAPGSFHVTGTSNEPPSTPEISITPTGSGEYVVSLQADRLGNGNGRTYTLTATAADLAGNTSTVTATCIVPHDQGK